MSYKKFTKRLKRRAHYLMKLFPGLSYQAALQLAMDAVAEYGGAA
jgi:hypothetical protein